MLNLSTGLQINRNCLYQPWSLENSLQIGIIYTCGPINRKLVFFTLEFKDFIMPMIVEFIWSLNVNLDTEYY
jgi:hypothetical protein